MELLNSKPGTLKLDTEQGEEKIVVYPNSNILITSYSYQQGDSYVLRLHADFIEKDEYKPYNGFFFRMIGKLMMRPDKVMAVEAMLKDQFLSVFEGRSKNIDVKYIQTQIMMDFESEKCGFNY